MPAARTARTRRRDLLLRWVLPAVGVGVFASLVLHLSGAGAPFWYTIALAALALVVLRVAQAAVYSTAPATPPDHGPEYELEQVVPALGVMERRLAGATRDRRLFHTTLRPALYDLARERVRRHGGADLGELADLAGSGRARDVLGEDLWRWLTDHDQDGPPLTRAQLTTIVTAVERL